MNRKQAAPLVDFHLHTTASDGCRTPAQVVDRALALGLCRMAVTDHDTVAGVAPAARAAAGRIPLVAGLEFTCREEALAPELAPVSVHLLGYGIDTENAALREALDRRAAAVRAAYGQLLNALAEQGCTLDYETIPRACGVMQLSDIDRAVQSACPHNPALRAQVQAHAAVMTRQNLPVGQAIALIHGAGGVAVWAHPFHIYRRFAKERLNLSQVEACLPRLRALGLDGLEAYYLDFPPAQRAELAALAAQQGLYCTAGSDCHGFAHRDRMGLPCPPALLAALPPVLRE